MKATLLAIILFLSSASALADDALDNIRHMLEDAPVQEKIYLHLDNNCYYRGEDIWYKAYVVRADDNRFTDMSRLLYVELVSPDGMLVERQTIAINADGDGEGSFYLADSLYSGFYEIRAYTRWMMNFCVTEHPSNYPSRRLFRNNQMASDFYRLYGTVYSRVVPVYETPVELGDYSKKYIVERPKTRLDKEVEADLKVNFYPEGGHLIAGTKATVAFEAVNELGEHVSVSGKVGGKPIKTEHEGRGLFTVDVPESGQLELLFRYADKDYHFKLPKTEKIGCALSVSEEDEDGVKADVTLRGVLGDVDYAAVVLSRGILKVFERFRPDDSGHATISIDTEGLPSGVSDLIIIDNDGRPMADRLFFVNHHDQVDGQVKVLTKKTDYQPYEAIDLELQVPEGTDLLSVSIRDSGTDDPTYDTGNIMTELLLSSELKGFIPHPDYYFEADDQQHRHHLDLLLMVQGWRRYNYEELTSGSLLRYSPEQGLNVEGNVYETVLADWEIDEVKYWAQGVFGYSETKAMHADPSDPTYKKLRERVDGIQTDHETIWSMDGTMELQPVGESIFLQEPMSQEASNSTRTEEKKVAIEHGSLKREVIVECELVELDENGEQLPGSTITSMKAETTNNGHFRFELPHFKNSGALFLRAYDTDLSDQKIAKMKWKGFLDDQAVTKYYAKRNLFFPVFAKKYSYYECHLPDDEASPLSLAADQVKAVDSLSSMDRVLSEIVVKKKRRRGRRAIDYTKPVCVYDAYELYNLTTDLGLSWGQFDMMNFPVAVSTALFGTYDADRFFNVQARINDNNMTPYVFFRNFSRIESVTSPYVSDAKLASWMAMKRQDNIRCYTDFELRNEDRPVVMQSGTADVTLQFDLLPDDGMRYVWRDRRITMQGIIEPEDFYLTPDYRNREPNADSYDYRRTLFWDPAAVPDDDGRLKLHLFNNGKQTRICVSAAGISGEGKLLFTSEYAK